MTNEKMQILETKLYFQNEILKMNNKDEINLSANEKKDIITHYTLNELLDACWQCIEIALNMKKSL